MIMNNSKLVYDKNILLQMSPSVYYLLHKSQLLSWSRLNKQLNTARKMMLFSAWIGISKIE